MVCRSCHIRHWVPVAEFQGQLQARGFSLDPYPLRTLRVEVTTAFKLRCTYCSVSQQGNAAQSTTSTNLEQGLTLLRY